MGCISISPKVMGLSSPMSRGSIPSTRQLSSRQVRGVARSGQAVFFRRVFSPEIWSEWVWVIRIAVRSAGVSPSSFRAAVIRRQEIPASISRWVSPQESTAAFPEEPLASVCTVVKKIPLFEKRPPGNGPVKADTLPDGREVQLICAVERASSSGSSTARMSAPRARSLPMMSS